MSHITYLEIHRYLPQGVKRIIAHGGGCWIGEVDDMTVLKYPHTREEMKWVQIEAKILSILGRHPRIVQLKGRTKDGLLLEFAPNGNLHDYLMAHPEALVERRLAWCMQATEAVAYIHSKRILHCDIRQDNLLLDANLDLKLADFQGQHFSADGDILLDALSLESTKAYLPRKPADHASIRTDLFALGSAIYFITTGHELFPDLDKPEDEGEVERRFRAGEFPTDPHVCAAITAKCWKQLYSSARQVLADLEAVREAIARGETPDSVAENVVSVPDKDATPPPATSWLSGLCDDRQGLKVPPPYRQLVGFD
ncbi:kinase-like protein [Zalerion maritima]|uniref:EKC/KEOPS complex subunit BUD32 n=1 Tax=Zalerion maritima TaxID=339359 RepID=A0AAD5WXD7_9PEZI|nr:kinase-like protein [Zalerion maritima]